MLLLLMHVAALTASVSAFSISGSANLAKRDVTNGKLVELLIKAGAGDYEKDSEHSGLDGEVFLMHAKKDANEKVAVKVDKGTGVSRHAESLKHEVKLLRALDGVDGVPKLIFPTDKNQAVGVLPIGDKKTLDFFIESAAGPDIATLLSREKISLDQAKHIVIEMARILGNIHAKGIAHKDPYSTNICINRENTEKLVLIDFGDSPDANAPNKFGIPYYVNDWYLFLKFVTFILKHRGFKPQGKYSTLRKSAELQTEMMKAMGLRDKRGVPRKSDFPKPDKLSEDFIAFAAKLMEIDPAAKMALTSWSTERPPIQPLTDKEIDSIKELQDKTG